MERQLRLFEQARLKKAEHFLAKLSERRTDSACRKALRNIQTTIRRYKRSQLPNFDIDRFGCFVDIVVQSVISFALYAQVGVDKLRERYGQAAFDHIRTKCRDALLTFWENGTLLEAKLDEALNNGWNDRTFMVLLAR